MTTSTMSTTNAPDTSKILDLNEWHSSTAPTVKTLPNQNQQWKLFPKSPSNKQRQISAQCKPCCTSCTLSNPFPHDGMCHNKLASRRPICFSCHLRPINRSQKKKICYKRCIALTITILTFNNQLTVKQFLQMEAHVNQLAICRLVLQYIA